MVDAGAHFHEDISAVVAVRTLSAAVYGLFPTEAGATGGVTKAQLRSLRGPNFRWPGEEAVRPETLPALAKILPRTSWTTSSREKAVLLCGARSSE